MERIIKVDNKDVAFRVDGGIGRLYRFVFGRDVFVDIEKIKKMIREKLPKQNENESIEDYEKRLTEVDEETLLSSIDNETIENVAWVMAKKADPNIPNVEKWLEGFNNPLAINIATTEILGLFNESVEGKVKSKNG